MNARGCIMTMLVVLVMGLASCSSDDPAKSQLPAAKNVLEETWVAAEPIQCLENPWEQDWLENHGWDYEGYPKDPTTPQLEPEEFVIIQGYYERQGVVVFEGENAPKYEEVCLACNCPEGQTLYLRVRHEDVPTMVSLGYRVESPPE
jgi:hypothetical protein